MTERRPTSDYLKQRELTESKRRRNRIIFGGIIIATLPFYCVGILLYVLAPPEAAAPPTNTPTQVITQDGGATLRPTNTLRVTNTIVPTRFATATEGFGVPPTVVPPDTATPTITPSPTNTPTITLTPTDANTATHTPTHTPAITDTPLPFLDS